MLGLLVVLAIAALLVIGGVVAAVVLGLNANKEGAGSPEEAVEKAYDALIAGDCQEAAKYVYGSSDKDTEECEESVDTLESAQEEGGFGDMKVEVIDSEIDGDEAVVTIEITWGGDSFEDEVNAIKKDGRWFIEDSLGGGDRVDESDSDDEATADPEPAAHDEADDSEPTDDIGGTSDLELNGTEFDPDSSVDMSDPVQVASAFV